MDGTSSDLRTLQFGPLWILSAIAGTSDRFHPIEVAAFWDILVAVALRRSPKTREILQSGSLDRRSLLMAFELDDRPVVSGLRHIVTILDRRSPDQAEDFKQALVSIGIGVARARGAYGRLITPENEQLLLLLAELLELETTPLVAEDAETY